MRAAWAWGPAAVWMAVIFYLSHQPVVEIPLGAPDYLAHGAGYAGLGALLVRARAGGHLASMSWAHVPVTVAVAVAYGLSDEWHQSFIPGRHPSMSDLVADGVGALVGAALAAWLGDRLRA